MKIRLYKFEQFMAKLFKRPFQETPHIKNTAIDESSKILNSARLMFASGEFQKALILCRNIIKLNPDNVEALLLLANIALKKGVREEDINTLREGIKITPHSADLHYNLGQLLFENQDYDEAITAFSSAYNLNPQFAKAYNNAGASLQMLGDIEQAFNCFKKAWQVDPTLWIAGRNVGNIYKLQGQLTHAVEPFQNALRARRAVNKSNTVLEQLDSKSTQSKLIHDIEQLHYLNDRGILNEEYKDAIPAFSEALSLMQHQFEKGGLVDFPQSIKPAVAPYFNRLLNFYNAPALVGGAINQQQDWAKLEADYFNNAPGMIFIDNFLKPEALESLRRFCLESTLWFDYLYDGGYVGCTCEDGFICPLLVQIAEEQRLAMPSVFGDNHIMGLWGYKYDSKRTGISAHADFAAVNANFWITPDDANVDPTSGGLIIWDKEAPLDWDFEDYNNNTTSITEFLKTSQAKPFVVPYKQNRISIFNSDLFHKTDSYHFKEGYENRRVNITMLYGYRKDSV